MALRAVHANGRCFTSAQRRRSRHLVRGVVSYAGISVGCSAATPFCCSAGGFIGGFTLVTTSTDA